MSGFTSFLKTILPPLLLALFLYLTLTHLLLPLYRRHYNRYSQYIPLHSTRLTSTTSSWWDGLRSRFRRQRRSRVVDGSRGDGQDLEDLDDLFDDEEAGEGMVRFQGVESEERRASLGADGFDGEGRLSRELEEGFRDDSDEEEQEQEQEEDGFGEGQ